jgi:hypothetical protein
MVWYIVLSTVKRPHALVLTITENKTEKIKKHMHQEYLIFQDEIFTWFCLLNLFIQINYFLIKR